MNDIVVSILKKVYNNFHESNGAKRNINTDSFRMILVVGINESDKLTGRFMRI